MHATFWKTIILKFCDRLILFTHILFQLDHDRYNQWHGEVTLIFVYHYALLLRTHGVLILTCWFCPSWLHMFLSAYCFLRCLPIYFMVCLLRLLCNYLIDESILHGVSGNPAFRQGKPGSGIGLGYGLRFKSQFGHFQVDYAINAFQQKTVYFGISNLASWLPRCEFHTSCNGQSS